MLKRYDFVKVNLLYGPVVIAQTGARVRQKCHKIFLGQCKGNFLEVSKTTYPYPLF